MSRQDILIRNGRVELPAASAKPASKRALVTVLSNLTYFGYALSEHAYSRLARASDDALASWWGGVHEVLATITGEDRKMGDFVVYKNFPAEVLAMSDVDYWTRQILMYWGFPNALFTEPEKERGRLDDAPRPRVLHAAEAETIAEIRDAMLRLPARWTDGQWSDVRWLVENVEGAIDLSAVPFKENMVQVASHLLAHGKPAEVGSATDVLRLAAGMSGGDPSLREPVKLRSFKRAERRYLIDLLERARSLDEDVRRRRGPFKRLMHRLHPGDYHERSPRVCAAYDKLYRDAPIETFNSKLEALISARDPAALALLETRPGELVRRLHHVVLLFGEQAERSFARVVPKLTTTQLLKIHRFLEKERTRKKRAFPPKGNWTKLQLTDADPERRLPDAIRKHLLAAIAGEIKKRVDAVAPVVALDPNARFVKLQTNDSDLSPYGRGTVFPLPDDIRFLRTASYWKTGPTGVNVWYDNGWNFFGDGWKDMGACCWNVARHGDGAIFSGDPTNSKDLEGRACQLIDLHLDELRSEGVRYAVWSLLCWSRRKFDEAEEVYAALQWGTKLEAGKLFEPSRCQLSFPVRGATFTKYVAYVDLAQRQIVYLDANLRSSVSSAAVNGKALSELMPAFVEYLDTLPSVYDLFEHQARDAGGVKILYSDAGTLLHDEHAYVFRQENKASTFPPIDLTELL
jgi:hypothetical protein